jgi:SAM-dependent methyltransferase
MAVAIEEVLWCYRALLGREPESDVAVQSHLGCDNFRQLAECFVQSQEFLAKRGPASVPGLAGVAVAHGLDLKDNEIEATATAEELAACIAVVRSTWTHLGTVKPHYSVLTEERYLPGTSEEELDTFWRSGESEAARVQRILTRHGFTDFADKTCVEFGCGVGRVTMGLAKRFAVVNGYDISSGHLLVARARARQTKIKNAIFRRCTNRLIDDLEPCDFYYSNIVFQHNPPPVIAELIRRALNTLRPGAIAIFQVPTYGVGYRFRLREWLAHTHPLDMQMHCLPQPRIFEIIRAADCLALEVREDNATGAPQTFISNTFIVRKSGGPG